MFSSGAFTSKNNTPGALIFGKQPDIMSLERYSVILPPYDKTNPITEGADEGAIMMINNIDQTNHLIYYKWSTQTDTPAKFRNVDISGVLNVCDIECNGILKLSGTAGITMTGNTTLTGDLDVTGDLGVTGDTTLGQVFLPSLPAAPGVSGQVYNDRGTVKISP